MNIENKCSIGDRVYIRELESRVLVTGIHIGLRGLRYDVEYFHNGKRESAYVFESEIELSRPKEPGLK